MRKIRMVDLQRQYDRLKPDIDRAMQEVIEGTAFINGPQVHAFRESLEDYLGVDHVIPCANGTDALQVALMALDLEPGDEVITTPFSFIASIEVIRLLRLKPVLADIDPSTFNIDPDQVAKALSPKTRAIIPVHLFGQCAFLEPLLALAQKHGLAIIEDTAQAIGTDYRFRDGTQRKAGTIGAIGTTSFFPSKTLGAYGDGGAIFTRDEALHKRIRTIVNHGSTVKYYYEAVGVNSRLDTLQAAILLAKLKHLDDFIAARQEAAAKYDRLLKGIPGLRIPHRAAYSSHTFHQYTLLLEQADRDGLADYLKSKEIPVMVYYPLSLHLQEAYRDLGYEEGSFPQSERATGSVFSIPMHTELENEQIEYICAQIREYLENHTG